MVSLEIAAALAWKAGDSAQFDAENAQVLSTREIAPGDPTLKINVDLDGNGNIHQYSIPPADIGTLLLMYRAERQFSETPGVVEKVAFPKRMPLPDPVERLVESDFIDAGLEELHDEGLDLEQFEGTEPRSLNFHRGVEDDVVEEHLRNKVEE